MAVTHQVLRQYADTSSNRIQLSEIISGGTEKNLDKSMAVGTDTAVAFTLDRTILQSLCLSSDVALTIKTNSSGSPTDTIVLVAGQALVWTLATDTLAKCPITATITSLFITNAAGGPAAFKLRSLST